MGSGPSLSANNWGPKETFRLIVGHGNFRVFDEADELIEILNEITVGFTDSACLGNLCKPCLGMYLHFLETRQHGFSNVKDVALRLTLALLLNKEQVIIGVDHVFCARVTSLEVKHEPSSGMAVAVGIDYRFVVSLLPPLFTGCPLLSELTLAFVDF
jgi:hypothetical protein